MRKYLKVMISLILCFCFIFSLAACNSDVETTSKPQNTNSEIKQDNTDSLTSSEEISSAIVDEEKNQDKIQYIDRYVEGTYSVVEAPSDAFEYIAGDNYTMMSGGADAEAAALRKKILEAKDTIKATGKTYYFSTDGNDDNDGLSAKTPFRSLGELRNLNLKPGDAVLFKRGCIFRTTTTVRLASGVYYGAYGEGEKPEIWGSAQNYAGKNLWKPFGNKKNFWVMELVRGDAGVVVIDNGALEGKNTAV